MQRLIRILAVGMVACLLSWRAEATSPEAAVPELTVPELALPEATVTEATVTEANGESVSPGMDESFWEFGSQPQISCGCASSDIPHSTQVIGTRYYPGPRRRSVLEDLSLFAGLEGSKQPQDFGVNANFGGRVHANLGLPLMAAQGVGIQLGTAINATDNAVQVFERVEGTQNRFQSFTTIGIFQRTAAGLSWAGGYDFLYQDSYDEFNLGQWRGEVACRLSVKCELGTWFAISACSDEGRFGATPVVLDPITQGSLFLRRDWENDAQTTVWLGVAQGHGEANTALGDLPPVAERVVFGADVFVPLSPLLALFGQANFITPADTGTVDAFLGVAFFPGGSHGARDRRFAPRLEVANNTTFATDLTRQ